MNYELTQKASDRRNFQRSYESARPLLKTSLSPLDYNHVCSVIETKALKIKERNSRKLEKKFNNLKRKFGIPKVSNLNNDDIIFNYSHRVLTETEKSVLARGLRFCLPPKDVDRLDVKLTYDQVLFSFRLVKHSGATGETKNRATGRRGVIFDCNAV